MVTVKNRLHLLLLPFALCGFALAQPVYQLLLQTPVFLLARQNAAVDVWVLAGVLSFVVPLALALPAWLTRRRWPLFSSTWCWLAGGVFAALFVAQLLQHSLGAHLVLYLGLAIAGGLAASGLLLFTRWSMLTTVLAMLAVVFPVWFLLFSPVMEQVDSFTPLGVERKNPQDPLPEIVFLILDELPLATLLDGDLRVDKNLFPGFARLQSMSNWYYNTLSASDGTTRAVPAILSGRLPYKPAPDLTVAAQPVNLFTVLGQHYRYNVAETVTRMCPHVLCPRSGPDPFKRAAALLLDMAAVYLHQVVPDRWYTGLPVVSDNWSGFFAQRQVFFPDGWRAYAGEQTIIDRPAFFKRFIDSIHKDQKAALNFLHILFPHGPYAYLPSGENYGLEWIRGQVEEQWGDVEWGVISAKQRHYLQVQYADRLLDKLLDHLQQQGMLDDSLLVVVADHGIGFALNDTRRGLSGTNAAAMLRVPLFIKYPGQRQGKRMENAVMTVDILPTLLTALGFSDEQLELSGIDLGAAPLPEARPRLASSFLQRELRIIDETTLDISPLVSDNRRQLKLDQAQGALWEIGPYDEFRGQQINTICEESPAKIRFRIQEFHELPNTRPQDRLGAYVGGIIFGQDTPADSQAFLITSNGIIVASGYTWKLKNRPQFFALVEPKFVKQADWAPRIWLIDGGKCSGG